METSKIHTTVRKSEDGTKSPWYEQYEKSNDGTKNPWYESSMVRNVHQWYETSKVRKVYGMKSPAFLCIPQVYLFSYCNTSILFFYRGKRYI